MAIRAHMYRKTLWRTASVIALDTNSARERTLDQDKKNQAWHGTYPLSTVGEDNFPIDWESYFATGEWSALTMKIPLKYQQHGIVGKIVNITSHFGEMVIHGTLPIR
jgi:hypothetical protein